MVCEVCLIEKDIECFRTNKKNGTSRRKKCRQCEQEILLKWRKENKDKFRESERKKYRRNKKNPLYMMKKILRNQVSATLRKNQITKSKSTIKYIGCTIEEFKAYIEKQFKPGMTWDNYGKYWHVDHIIPLGLATTEEQVKELLHYTNLQPLEAKKNLKKGKKLEYVFI